MSLLPLGAPLRSFVLRDLAQNITRQASSSTVVARAPRADSKRSSSHLRQLAENTKHITDFPAIYPDFAQSPVWNRRNKLKEELERADMLERRMHIDIPEFYVGSIVAVTTVDANLGAKEQRFVGICIRREREGLKHQFTLRNVIDGMGVEVMYELYNPTIKKIETLKLEKRLDNDLRYSLDEFSYLVDAQPEYSTFDFHMEPIAHPAGTPVHVNNTKVKLRPPPWTRRWELFGLQGVDDAWTNATPWFKRKFHVTKVNDYQRYDLIADYRQGSTLEHELKVEADMQRFEKQRHQAGLTRRRIFRSAAAAR